MQTLSSQRALGRWKGVLLPHRDCDQQEGIWCRTNTKHTARRLQKPSSTAFTTPTVTEKAAMSRTH